MYYKGFDPVNQTETSWYELEQLICPSDQNVFLSPGYHVTSLQSGKGKWTLIDSIKSIQQYTVALLVNCGFFSYSVLCNIMVFVSGSRVSENAL